MSNALEDVKIASLPSSRAQPSCFRRLEVREHVTLLPGYIGRISAGVLELLTCRVLLYHEAYGGVLVAVDHVRVLQSAGRILDELPHVHMDILYQAIVFSPQRGDVMCGYITQVGRDHVGCVLYGCFNASVVCSVSGDGEEGVRSEWWTREFGEGEKVWFVVTQLDVTGSLLSLRGEYISAEGEGGRREECTVGEHLRGDDVVVKCESVDVGGEDVIDSGVSSGDTPTGRRHRNKKKRDIKISVKEEVEEGGGVCGGLVIGERVEGRLCDTGESGKEGKVNKRKKRKRERMEEEDGGKGPRHKKRRKLNSDGSGCEEGGCDGDVDKSELVRRKKKAHKHKHLVRDGSNFREHKRIKKEKKDN